MRSRSHFYPFEFDLDEKHWNTRPHTSRMIKMRTQVQTREVKWIVVEREGGLMSLCFI